MAVGTDAASLRPSEEQVEWRVEIDLVADEPVLPVHLRHDADGVWLHTPRRKAASTELTIDVRPPWSPEDATLLVAEGDVLHTGAACRSCRGPAAVRT